MEFRILGPLEVRVDGRPVDVGGTRQRAVLAVLLLRANRIVSTDHLIEAVWDEQPPETAPKVLQVYVSQLRKALGRDRIVTQAPGYLINVEPGELDAERFQKLIDEGKPEEALELWRGQPLADFAYESFAQPEIARLEELRASALEERIEADLARGRHGTVVSELEGLVRDHPLRERFSRQLMLALYRSGRQADALDVYQRARRASVEQLGIEPSPALRELERQILNQDESLGPPPGGRAERARSGRSGYAIVGAAALVAAVAVAAVLASRDNHGSLVSVPPNSVAVIDPGTNDVVASVPVGVRPGPVAAGAGAVWVGNLGDRTLTKIDPDERTTAATITLGERTPTGLAVGGGAVWVAHGLRGELSRVDPQFSRLLRTVSVTGRSEEGGVALGGRYVWAVYGDSTLARVRADSVEVAGSVLTDAIPTGLVVVGPFVWVANGGAATVERFSAATFADGPIRRITVGKRPSAIAYGEGALWVANRGDDSVSRIDIATSSAYSIPVGDEPVAIAVGHGAVWVANSGDRSLSRIDPTRNVVSATIGIGSTPAGIAVDDGVVWVSTQAV